MECPTCKTNGPSIYVGLNTVECTNLRCPHFNEDIGAVVVGVEVIIVGPIILEYVTM